MDPWTAAKPRSVVRERCLLFETLVTYLWYGGVAGDGLRSVGVEDLPLTKSGCSILPTARLLRVGVQLPGPRFLEATAVLAALDRGEAMFSDFAPALLTLHTSFVS